MATSKNIQDCKLSRRQTKAIPFFIAPGTLEEACRGAKVSRAGYFLWMKNPEFKKALQAARNEATGEALELLKGGITKAIKSILELAQDEDKWLRLRACERILEAFWRAKELGELEERIKAIEERLEKK